LESNFKNNPKNRLQDVSLINALNSAVPSEYPVNNLIVEEFSKKIKNQYSDKGKKS